MKQTKYRTWIINMPKSDAEKFIDLLEGYLPKNNVTTWEFTRKNPVGLRTTLLYSFDVDKYMFGWVDHSLAQAFAGLSDDLYITIERKDHEVWQR